jgi:hypothetical protein
MRAFACWTSIGAVMRKGIATPYVLAISAEARLNARRSGGSCQWRLLPKDFPLYQTVYDYFRQWRLSGDWARMHDTLRGDVPYHPHESRLGLDRRARGG